VRFRFVARARIAAVILVALAAGVFSFLGGACERRHPSLRAVVRVILKLMLYVLVPFVAFVNLAHLQMTFDAAAALICAYGAVLSAGVTGWLVGREVLKLQRAALGALICSAIVANTGYLGLPVTVALLGVTDLRSAVAYDALVSGPMLYLFAFGVGAAFASRGKRIQRAGLRAFVRRNPPLVAAVAGLLVPASLVPEALVQASEIVVAALLPLGFFVVGVNLSAANRESPVRLPRRTDAPVALALVLRLAVAPLLLAGLSITVIHVPPAYILESAMPTGISTLVIGHGYGLDERQIAATIAWGTFVCLALGLVALAM
jgi:predicted permease